MRLLLAYASSDYSGGGYPAQQYSMPPPSINSGDSNYNPAQQQQGSYNASGYSGQNSGPAWNQQSSGSKYNILSLIGVTN